MEETSLVFRPFFSLWLLLPLAALMAALLALAYARTTRPVPRWFQLALLGLRLTALAAAVVCLLRPSLETTHYEVVKRPLLMLVDRSRSMQEINDTPNKASRMEAADKLLGDSAAQLEALGELYDVTILSFARGLLGRGPVADEAAIRHSAYGLALEQAFVEVGNSQSEAVIIIGDGSHNWGPPDPLDVAAALNDQGVPIYTVGVGQDEATSELRDVKVLDVVAPKQALLFTSFTARPQVLFRGCQGLPVRVQLEFAGQPPQERAVTVTHSEEIVPLEFEVVPETVGEYKVSVRAESVPNEVLDTNNSAVTYVKVISGGVRVGFFDTVRPESKFIAASLMGAGHLSLRRVLVLAGQRLPEAASDVGRYDVIMLGDLSSSALLPSRMLELKRGVQDEGKGLIVLLSQTSAGLAGWRGTPLEDILPVRVAPGTSVAPGKREFRVAAGQADHPVLALGPTAEATLKAWALLPPLAGAVTGTELKRGAVVLAQDQEANPLLAVQRSGRGRVACLMADTTFRWYFTEQATQDYHRRFWRQLVLWAAGREEKPQNELQLELSEQRLTLGEDLKITVRLVGASGEPIRDARLALRVTDPGGQAQEVPCTFARQAGAYLAQYTPAVSGDYAVSAEARRGDESLGWDKSYFHATATDVELEEPIADLSLLRRMSAVTEQAGGRYFHYTQAAGLFEELKRRGKPLTLTTRRRDDAWDRWPLFAALGGCLVAEWALRKWKGLV
jgi:uncharacterized membrane protein